MDRNMVYGKYRFLCRLENEAVLPFFKGSTFRGVFGHALKRVVCALKLRECSECMLRESCLYCLLFENAGAHSQSGVKGNYLSPHPFVIEPPTEGERRFGAGERFECSLILFGEVNDKLPYFVYAFEQMGDIGIGGRVNGSRGRFVLEEVQSGEQVIYSEGTRKLLKAEAVETLNLSAAGERAEKVRVTLETPLRLKFESRLTADLPFHVLVRAMLRRVSSLFNAFGNGEPELDYRSLVREAETVQARDSTLRWFDWERYSNRQNTRMFMGGIVGSVTYTGDLGEYLPLMEIASKVHIGKQTTFG
ncbi:MAG: CRISPR system precrRNA processing endoribonuclease RAMP protein Cas6, partial [Desulfobacterales bacterium]|nr:CRISPR system precrRNA processing endoribonuclease RAMP protein Cas6 [Desulfobacterales bacterium]